MSLITLVVLTSLSITLLSLAQTEPTIASNHLRSAQAHAMADSGVARAIWALTHATAPGGFGGAGELPNVAIATTAAPPYDGASFIAVGPAGGFHLTLGGSDPNLRVARVVGWTPTSELDDPRTRSKIEVLATLVRVRNLAREVPCALCAGTSLSLAASLVDARGSEATDCGAKVGVAVAGALTPDALSQVHGAGAPTAPAGIEGRDWRQHQALGAFLSSDDLDTLRTVAMERGTYIRPSSETRIDPLGVGAGLVFVDTPAGTNALSDTNLANVGIGPGFAASPPFRGWLVVIGDIALAAGADLDALVYAVNAVTTEGPAEVSGALVAEHRLGTTGTLTGLTVRFDCAAARAPGLLPGGWFIRTGTYCDGTAGC